MKSTYSWIRKKIFQIAQSITLLSTLFVVSGAQAAIATFTNSGDFNAAIAGFITATEDFESTVVGTEVQSGNSVGGLTFSYSFSDPLRLAVTDGVQFGGSLPAPTTSGSSFLASNDFDVLAGGDDFSISFAAANAIGLYIISADIPEVNILNDDLRLSVGGDFVALDVDALTRTDLGDNNYAYFLGLVDDTATFTSASLIGTFPGAPFFVVDDITLGFAPAAAVPAPEFGAPASLFLGLAGLTGYLRRRSPHRDRVARQEKLQHKSTDSDQPTNS